MRTTVNLPDQLAEAAKGRAAAEGRTFTSLLEEALRALLDAQIRPTQIQPLPTHGTGSGKVLVDLDDTNAVWATLDAVEDDPE